MSISRRAKFIVNLNISTRSFFIALYNTNNESSIKIVPLTISEVPICRADGIYVARLFESSQPKIRGFSLYVEAIFIQKSGEGARRHG